MKYWFEQCLERWEEVVIAFAGLVAAFIIIVLTLGHGYWLRNN